MEEALLSSPSLSLAMANSNLIAYADDMVITTLRKERLEEYIEELEKLEASWKIKLNKKKCEILIKDFLESDI